MRISKLVLDYFVLTNQFEDKSVSDAVLDRDYTFFINANRLKKAETPEFKNTYEHLNQSFSEIVS